MQTKRYLLSVSFLILSASLMAQAPGGWLWANNGAGDDNDVVNSVETDAAGNSYATGYFRSASLSFGSTTLTNAGNEDIFLVKYDPSGNVLWAKQAGGPTQDIA